MTLQINCFVGFGSLKNITTGFRDCKANVYKNVFNSIPRSSQLNSTRHMKFLKFEIFEIFKTIYL